MGVLDRLWTAIGDSLFGGAGRSSSAGTEAARQRAQSNALVVWLLGKTGAGKTAIVAALTGDPRAEVGQGFEPCTRTASFYDVPPEAPLLRFLDTRGLGEASYDPVERHCPGVRSNRTSLLVVMQVSDPAQHVVLQALEQARREHPAWPIVVAQTGLHRLYPRRDGASDFPIHSRAVRKTYRSRASRTRCVRRSPTSARCSTGCAGHRRALCRSISPCRKTGFHRTDYGLDLLWQVLEEVGPVAFEALHRANADAESDRTRAKARPLIYGYGAAAAGAGAVPVPLVGLGGLAGVITLMLRTLAVRYDVAWTPERLRTVQRSGRRRCAGLVGAAIWPARNAQAHSGGGHCRGRCAQCGGGLCGDGRDRRGGMRMAGLSAAWPRCADRRGAARVCGGPGGGIAASQGNRARKPEQRA